MIDDKYKDFSEGGTKLVVYTDGSCLGNPGAGGWAYAVKGGRWRSGCSLETTNQRMELTAASCAVGDLSEMAPIVIVSDSSYVVNCFKYKWWEGWLRRGWRNSSKKPVANRDLWEPFIDEVIALGDGVKFVWVKGHSGDVMNDVADSLAVRAAREQVGMRGIIEVGADGTLSAVGL